MCVSVGLFFSVWGNVKVCVCVRERARVIEKGKAREFASHTHLGFAYIWTAFKEAAEACLGMCVCRWVGGCVFYL